jgi:uncharacterized membrane-anchored protein
MNTNLDCRTYYKDKVVSKTITDILDTVIESSMKLADNDLNKELVAWFKFTLPYIEQEVDTLNKSEKDKLDYEHNKYYRFKMETKANYV